MTSGFSNRTGEVLPVREGPRHNVCERFAKGIWRLLQRSQAKLTVETYLVWLQPSKVHEITHKAAECRGHRPERVKRAPVRCTALFGSIDPRVALV